MSGKIVLLVCVAMVLVVCFMSNLASAGEELSLSGGAGNESLKAGSKRLVGMRKVKLGALNDDGGEDLDAQLGSQDDKSGITSQEGGVEQSFDLGAALTKFIQGAIANVMSIIGGLNSGRSGKPDELVRQVVERLYQQYVPEGSQRSCGAAQQAKAAAARADEETASSDSNKDAMAKLVQMLVQLQSNGKGGKAKSRNFQG